MIEYFKDLPTKQKIGFVCLLIAGLGFLFSIIAGAMSSGESTPEPSASTPVVGSEPSASASATTEPTATATATATATSMPEIKYGENKIPVAEIRALQDVANKGITEFLKWSPNESPEARTARIAPFFVANSEFATKAPDFQESSRYKTESGQGGMVSEGRIDFINPVGGDEATYRLTLGSVLRAQYNYENTGTEKSGVVQTSETLTIDMTKVDGAWKIKTISQD